MLPKPDGGMRPITLTSVMCRMMAAALVREWTGWQQTWLPQESTGGAEERSCIYSHAVLRKAAKQVEDGCGSEAMAFISEDLSKAFDRILLSQAVAVLTHLDLSIEAAKFILNFYGSVERVFRVDAYYSRTWRKTPVGILQGCPFSVMLLAAGTSRRMLRAAGPSHHRRAGGRGGQGRALKSGWWRRG